MMKRVVVLRLGHRIKRDKRITTHCGLVARAFGANEFVFSGERDDNVIESIKKVCEKWGSSFEFGYERDWLSFIKKFPGIKVHLTMYGLEIQKEIMGIRKKAKEENVLIIIGSEKVPFEVFSLSDYNIAVTNQPHSEVAALALFLHLFFGGKEFEKDFGGRIRIIPCKKGKKVIEKKDFSFLGIKEKV